jgi:hypothetical protein
VLLLEGYIYAVFVDGQSVEEVTHAINTLLGAKSKVEVWSFWDDRQVRN